MSSAKSDHILVINSLRGIAAISVVLYHFICKTVDYVHNEAILSIFHYGQKGVQLFFIISGIVIPLSMIKGQYKLNKWRKFILKRFIRIEPPYLVAVAIGAVYLIVRNYIPGTVQVDLAPTIDNITLHVGYLIPFVQNAEWINPVFWTLAIEFQYYIALSLLLPLALSNNMILRILFYAAFICGAFLPIGTEFFPFWSSYFLVGITYVLFANNLIGKIEYVFISSVLIGVIYYNQGHIDLGIAVCAIGIVHYLPKIKSKVTLFLGKISYSLYLVHTIIGAAFVNYLSHQFVKPYQMILVILGGVGISVASAFLMYKLVEKPTHNYAKKIK